MSIFSGRWIDDKGFLVTISEDEDGGLQVAYDVGRGPFDATESETDFSPGGPIVVRRHMISVNFDDVGLTLEGELDQIARQGIRGVPPGGDTTKQGVIHWNNNTTWHQQA